MSAVVVIPAERGYFVLTLEADGTVSEDPVLAWSCDPSGARRPITAHQDLGPRWSIQFPSGAIDEQDRAFTDREAWLATVIEERATQAPGAEP